MKNQTFGSMIVQMRKEKGITQLELAEEMGVTDKAVSKWERDLSFPDVSSIPRLAEYFGVTTDELMQVREGSKEKKSSNNVKEIINIALKGVGLAMGVAVLVLTILKELVVEDAVTMLGIGLICLAVAQLQKKEE